MAGLGETILVVDDEPSDLEVARTALEGLGYNVLAAGDGPSALSVYREFGEPIALLVTDVAMSPMSGCELAVRLAAIQMDMKILFVSGYAGAGVLRREKVAELKAAFLRKPFTAEQLTECVQALLAPRVLKTARSVAQ